MLTRDIVIQEEAALHIKIVELIDGVVETEVTAVGDCVFVLHLIVCIYIEHSDGVNGLGQNLNGLLFFLYT